MRAKCKVCIYNEVNKQYFVANAEKESGHDTEDQRLENEMNALKEQMPAADPPAAPSADDPLSFFKNELQKGTYASVINIVNSVKQKKKKLEAMLP